MKFLDLYYLVQCEPLFYTDQEFCSRINELYEAYKQVSINNKAGFEAEYVANLKNYLINIKAKPGIEFGLGITDFLNNTKQAPSTDSEPIHNGLIKKIPLASLIPAQVAIEDLKENGRMATDQTYQAALAKFESDPSLNQLVIDEIEFIRFNDKYYMVYPEKISEGSFGEVYLMQNFATGEWEILKTLTLDRLENSRRYHKQSVTALTTEKDFENEVDNLKQQEQYLGHFIENTKKGKKAYVGMKRAYGVTLEHCYSEDVFPIRWLQDIKAILMQAKRNYDQGYLHRDLRPPNIIIDPVTGKVTLIDPGLRVKFDPKTGQYEEEDYKKVGHPAFMGQDNRNRISQSNANAKPALLFNQQTELSALAVTIGYWLKLADFNPSGPTFFDPKLHSEEIAQSPLPDMLKNFIIKLLQQMCSANADTPPTFDIILDKIKKFEKPLLKVTGKFNKVGIVNLEEMIDKEGNINAMFITPLRSFDKVYLLYPKQTFIDGKDGHLDSIIGQLTKEHGVRVVGVLETPAITSDNLPQLMVGIEKNIANAEHSSVINCHLLTTSKQTKVNSIRVTAEVDTQDKNSKKETKHEISPHRHFDRAIQINNFNIVIKELHVEFKKATAAVKNSNRKQAEQFSQCANAIQQTMKTLSENYKANQFNYKNLCVQLSSLEKQIVGVHTNKLEYYMAKWFKFGVIGKMAGNIKNIGETVVPKGKRLTF